jgi:hypothetical protein
MAAWNEHSGITTLGSAIAFSDDIGPICIKFLITGWQWSSPELPVRVDALVRLISSLVLYG